MDKLFGLIIAKKAICRCENTDERLDLSHVQTLQYPSGEACMTELLPFVSLLEQTFFSQQIYQAWCENCQKYQSMVIQADWGFHFLTNQCRLRPA